MAKKRKRRVHLENERAGYMVATAGAAATLWFLYWQHRPDNTEPPVMNIVLAGGVGLIVAVLTNKVLF